MMAYPGEQMNALPTFERRRFPVRVQAQKQRAALLHDSTLEAEEFRLQMQIPCQALGIG